MYDFRLSLLTIIAVFIVGGGSVMVAGELSAVEKSLQFEAAFQGKHHNNNNKGQKTKNNIYRIVNPTLDYIRIT